MINTDAASNGSRYDVKSAPPIVSTLPTRQLADDSERSSSFDVRIT